MEHKSDDEIPVFEEEKTVRFVPSMLNDVKILETKSAETPKRRKRKKRTPRRSKSALDPRSSRGLKNEPSVEWLTTLVSRHSCNITEEQRAKERRRIERQRRERQERAAQSARRAKTLCTLSSSSRSATFTSYRSLSTRLSTPVSARRSVQIRDDLFRHEASMNSFRSVINTPELQTEEVAENVLASLDVETDISESEIDKLLRELRPKPKDDEEASSKFAMYEEYAKTVETTREGLCKFWEDCKDSFEGRICAAINRDIVRLDSHQNMGIAWNERVWWAYEMIKVANKNNLNMIRLLETIQTKLELIARDEDCPICLEPKEAKHTLTCCHKICKGCWSQWQLLQGRNAFCPLCKEKDFISAVLAAEDHPLISERLSRGPEEPQDRRSPSNSPSFDFPDGLQLPVPLLTPLVPQEPGVIGLDSVEALSNPVNIVITNLDEDE